MKIETKYEVGNKVWIRALGYNKKVEIIGITVNIRTNSDVIITYGLENSGYYYQRYEDSLFPTKEELLKSL